MTEHADALREKAISQGWKVMLMTETHPGGNGYVPHGFALIERERYPFEGRQFATLRWYVQPSGPGFESGNYDLSYEDALGDYRQRVREAV